MLPESNPFAAASPLPYLLPPFDRIETEHFGPAFEAGTAEQLAEVDRILATPGEPTFADTIEALEASGALLERVSSAFFNLVGSISSEPLRALEAEVAPRLTAHRDAIQLDPRLFARVDALYRRRAELDLDAEALRLLERYHLDLVRAGAALAPEQQAELRELNTELSALTTAFARAVQNDSNQAAVHLTERTHLAGLPEDAVAAAEQAAAARGLDGVLLTLVLPTGQPALASLHDREVRRRLHTAAVTRGLRGDANDTRATLTRIVALRARRAALLGYPDHAAYTIADQTAGSVEAVLEMLTGLVPAAVANARTEAAELAAALHADGHEGPLQAWDWAYYAERVRRERYAVDSAQLRPYFELGRVLEHGVFAAAELLYGLRFRSRPDLPAYHPDVQVYEVFDGDRPLGLFLADWYARDSKRGGAWMSTFVDQSRLLDRRPVVVINLNVPRPAPGEPALLTLDEVRTAFHEFGHVLHGLLSDVRYPRFSGTSVPRDFVEFPSQVNEMWAMWPELLGRYARHHRTGEPLPEATVRQLRAAEQYGEGFATVEYLAAALLDLAWHRLAGERAQVAPEQVEEFEAAVLREHGLDLAAVPPRYRSSYFAHVFSGGYSAGYYSYIWSEVLDADLVEWFTERGGATRDNGEAFRTGLLARGGSVDPMAAFAAVRGRAPRLEPLLARRGLGPVTG